MSDIGHLPLLESIYRGWHGLCASWSEKINSPSIMKKKNITLLAVCFLLPWSARAQQDTLGHERNITLSEAIALARIQSVDAAVALNELTHIVE